MDALQRALYWSRFRAAFLERKGSAFQDWFGDLAEFALGSDFERIRPYGAEGDFKADGRTLSDQTVYQCYAPETLRQDRLIAKIKDDFAGAVGHWSGWMRRWVFVHNDLRGLPPRTLQTLDELRASHQSIEVEIWSRAALTRLADRMDLLGWEALFDVVPSRTDGEAVATEDVAEVIRHLQQAEPPSGEEPMQPPSVDKIAKNELSPEVQELLRIGQRKDPLVKRFLEKHHRPELGERIAEAFRRRYGELKERERSPDDIFLGLQRAFGDRGTPKREVASLAVLSYLFYRCDIFEDPEAPP